MREIGNRLNLREDDALWPLLAALEYQRVYYEALPKKIAAASKTIMDGMAAAAEKETAAAQARLTASVVQEAQNLASKIQYGKLVTMWLLALICLLAYGSLMLWAGFRIDTGQDMPLAAVFQMPSGWLICGLSLVAGVFLCALSGKTFSVEGKGWWKTAALAMGFIMTGAVIFTLLL
ncbi:hypothetical protein [uncultured Desulfovibrio sp.]|uniref:hypothetical protein n=1 Tax=uncultured Desulfovibrio sp. TaxID=167968 RepID=UPI0026077BB9|nr:hypothetical protein [uncultured Desulfovibrio sp.]